MAHLENASIGLKLEIDDQDQLEIDSRDLVPAIKGSMSVSRFQYAGETLAYMIVQTAEADASGMTALLLKALARHSYITHGEMVSRNGLHYYLTCLDTPEDARKTALVQSIRDAYDRAEFSAPVTPLIETVDFKAVTPDGNEVGNEIFAGKACTVVNIWATTCRTCLEVMPELVKWEKELPENVQLLYLTAEKEGLAKLDRAVLNQKIAEFGISPDRVLLYETGFSKVIDIILSATPTTFFVDASGTIVSDVILGPDIPRCKAIVNSLVS